MPAPKGNQYAKGCKTSGRPAKLDESNSTEVAEAMIDFFKSKFDTFKDELLEYRTGNREHEPLVDLPFYYEFADEVGISYRTMKYRESGEDKEFHQAWNRCKQIQARYISLASMNGLSNPTFSIFAASNLTQWRKKQQVTGEDDGPIQIEGVEISVQ